MILTLCPWAYTLSREVLLTAPYVQLKILYLKSDSSCALQFNNALNLADHTDVWNNPLSFDPTSFQDAGQHDPGLFMTQGPAYNSEQQLDYTHDGLPMWGDINAAGLQSTDFSDFSRQLG